MDARKLILMFGLISTPAFAGVVEAQKDGVDVYAAADKGSAVLVKLKKGETLTSQERSGMYWQVSAAGGKTGYVSVLAVKIKAEDKAGLNEAMREAVKNGRSQSAADGGRTRSAVMGVRGLDDTSDTSLAASLRPNLHAVYAMEDYEMADGGVSVQADLVTKEIESKLARQK